MPTATAIPDITLERVNRHQLPGTEIETLTRNGTLYAYRCASKHGHEVSSKYLELAMRQCAVSKRLAVCASCNRALNDTSGLGLYIQRLAARHKEYVGHTRANGRLALDYKCLTCGATNQVTANGIRCYSGGVCPTCKYWPLPDRRKVLAAMDCTGLSDPVFVGRCVNFMCHCGSRSKLNLEMVVAGYSCNTCNEERLAAAANRLAQALLRKQIKDLQRLRLGGMGAVKAEAMRRAAHKAFSGPAPQTRPGDIVPSDHKKGLQPPKREVRSGTSTPELAHGSRVSCDNPTPVKSASSGSRMGEIITACVSTTHTPTAPAKKERVWRRTVTIPPAGAHATHVKVRSEGKVVELVPSSDTNRKGK